MFEVENNQAPSEGVTPGSCPFCGSTRVTLHDVEGWKSSRIVSCLACHGRGPMQKGPVAAIAAWNRRPEPEQELADVTARNEAWETLEAIAETLGFKPLIDPGVLNPDWPSPSTPEGREVILAAVRGLVEPSRMRGWTWVERPPSGIEPPRSGMMETESMRDELERLRRLRDVACRLEEIMLCGPMSPETQKVFHRACRVERELMSREEG